MSELNENLNEYYQAIQSEFTESKLSDSDQLAETVRKNLFELLDSCKSALHQILLTGDSDSARLQAVKLVFAYTLGDGKASAQENDINKLVESLKANDSKVNKTKL